MGANRLVGQNPTNLSVNVHEVAARQGGHVTRQQLLELGMTSRTAERWIAAGQLIRVHRGVYAVGHLPTNPIDRAHGALLAAGPGSALSHSSALVLWGAWKRWPHRLDVTITGDRRSSGLEIHRVRALLPRDVTIKDGVRVTSPARTALDHAAATDLRRLKGTVDHLRLRHGMTLKQLHDVAVRNPYHHGTTLLLTLTGGASAQPSRSGFERQWPAFAARHELPAYETNTKVAGFEVDVLVAGAVIVELDTVKTHLLNFESDRARDASILAATGIPTIRATWDRFRKEPGLLADEIRRAVSRRSD
jgi:hypothetical protein